MFSTECECLLRHGANKRSCALRYVLHPKATASMLKTSRNSRCVWRHNKIHPKCSVCLMLTESTSLEHKTYTY